MKGFSIKKLAAIAAGAALVGSALAPVVSAQTVAKGDIYGSDGSPNVSIVVGSMANASDAVWAGNIAAKIAEKAGVMMDVGVSGASEGAACSLEDLTVDLTVGGTETYSGGAYTFKSNLLSTINPAEINSTDDVNLITDAKLSNLFNGTISEKIAGTSTNTTVQEKIGLKVDAKMDTSDVGYKDLLGVINSEDFFYKVSFSPALTFGASSFTDTNSSDNVKIMWFGKEYSLASASSLGTSSSNLKLVKTSARETYNEGETITGLVGRNLYDGEELEVKVAQIAQYGTAVLTYQATFELYDSEGTLVDSQTVTTSANLADEFTDADDDPVLGSNLFVDVIAVGATTGVGYVEVTKGTDTVLLYNGKGYPYDSTDTSNQYPWKVEIGGTTTTLSYIKIKNSRVNWIPNPTSDGFEPLYPSYAGQSLLGNESESAVFLQGLSEDIAGYSYAKVDFQGFETGKEITTVKFMKGLDNLPSNAPGGVYFRGDGDEEHYIPYYFTHTTSDDSFVLDSKTIYADVNYNTGNLFDVNVISGAYVNGCTWTWSASGGGSAGKLDLNTSCGTSVADLVPGSHFDVNGTTFILDYNSLTASAQVKVKAKVRYRTSGDSTNPSGIVGTWDSTDCATTGSTYETCGWYLLAGDMNLMTVPVPLEGADSETFDYYLKLNTNNNRIYALLAAQTFGNSNVIQNNHAIKFLGTDAASENGVVDKLYYNPNVSDFNSAYSSINYQVGKFQVIPADALGDFFVFVDTQDGGNLGPYQNTNLSTYSYDANYGGTPSLTLTSGTGNSNYYTAAYADTGSKIKLLDSDAGAQIELPENRRQVWLTVSGSSVEKTVTGGETLSVALGETGTTSGGTSITVQDAEYEVSCEGGDASGCVADPETYMTHADVSNPLVYLDNEAPVGAKVIVGGGVVNTIAAQVVGLADRLTTAGEYVMELDDTTGNVIVAGYTKEDTVKAAKELINLIDGFA
ncbi:MAG: S-layer protein [Candidatus Diapherotrites archaeon]|nr:S-layer protein [Candidatus Diapherotrites archaeon]